MSKNLFKAYLQTVIRPNDRFLSDYESEKAKNEPRFYSAVPWPIYYEIEQLAKCPANELGETITTRALCTRILQVFILTANANVMSREYIHPLADQVESNYHLTEEQKNELINSSKMTKTGRYWLRIPICSRGAGEKNRQLLFDALLRIAYNTTPGGVGDRIYSRTYILCLALASFLDDYENDQKHGDERTKYLDQALSRWTADGFR